MLQPLEAAGIHGRKIRARMKKVIAASLSGLLTAYVLAIFLPINPDEARPGARLSGEVAEGDVDWSFIQGVTLVIVQTKTWYLIPHSVTVTSWVTDGHYYLGCGQCATKVWPTHIARDPEVVVKIDGKLYEGQAFRATGSERHRALAVPLGDDIPDADEAYRVDLR